MKKFFKGMPLRSAPPWPMVTTRIVKILIKCKESVKDSVDAQDLKCTTC